MRIEFFNAFSLGPIILLGILSADGRWVGALFGALLPGGRKGLRTMRLVIGSMACAPTQLAVATLALHTRLISESTALALLGGAALIAITDGARRRMALQLASAEDELDRAEDT